MSRSKRWLLLSAVTILVVASGISHRGGSGNAALSAHSPTGGYRFENLPPTAENSHELLVILTFSGGGTRAAALAYGVLLELDRTEFVLGGRKRTLLDEVDVISSVSGGSFTAAYYGLHRKEIFKTFEGNFLHRNITRRLGLGVLRPDRALALPFTYYNRTGVASELYRKVIGNATYEDLQKKGRPFIIINATDLSRGIPFEFTQNRFDFLCSDLSRFHVAHAVAASAGFPGLLTPMRMENFAGRCGFKLPEAVEMTAYDRDDNPHRYKQGNDLRSYLDAQRRPYVHLIDGGVGDNLGLHTVLDSLNEDISDVSMAGEVEDGKVKRVVVIVVDAGTEEDDAIDRSPRTPGVGTVIARSAYAPIDNYSFQLIDLVRINLLDLKANVHLMHITFDRLPPESSHFKRLPTNFNLPPKTVNAVRDAGRLLLRNDPKFIELKQALATSR